MAETQKCNQTMKNLAEFGIICCDSNDVICSWDAKAEELFGWSFRQVKGRNIFPLLFPQELDEEATSRLAALFGSQHENQAITLYLGKEAVHRNGSSLPVELLLCSSPGKEYFTLFVQRGAATKEEAQGETERLFKLEVANTILKKALAPSLLKDRLTDILSYLTTIEEIEFNPEPTAALFLVEQDTGKLVRTITLGPTGNHLVDCDQVVFGHCHCGSAAQTQKLQFVAACSKEQGHSHGHYCVPLTIDDSVIGVITVFTADHLPYSTLTADILIMAAETIAALIDNQKMDLQLISLVNDLRTSVLALQEEKKFSESIIQGLQHGLIVTDQHGTIQKSNSAAESIFDWFSDGLEGVCLDSLVGRENSERILTSSSSGALPKEAELLLTGADGSQMIIRYSAISRSISGKKEPGHIISLTNISEWRQVRKEMEKMNRLSTIAELASAVAHEVRNPLAGIKIMAQSIEENSGTRDEREECSRRIIRQVDRLNELLTDFFSYARPVTPKKRQTSLTEILAETKPLIAGRLEKQRIQLVENFDDTLPTVIADPNQLQQVFLNLFLNAIDAIRQEGIIEISACRLKNREVPIYCREYHLLQKGIPYVMLHFTDNGAGMSKRGAERVFEPFYTTKTNGSGLGMSIVHRTLQENDAAITVSSTEGKGTTFTMFFKTGE